MSFIPNIWATEVEITRDEWNKPVGKVCNMSGAEGEELKMYLTIPTRYVGRWARFQPSLDIRLVAYNLSVFISLIVSKEIHDEKPQSILYTFEGWQYHLGLDVKEWKEHYYISDILPENVLIQFGKSNLVSITIDDYVYSFIDNTEQYNTEWEGGELFKIICQKIHAAYCMLTDKETINVRHEE